MLSGSYIPVQMVLAGRTMNIVKNHLEAGDKISSGRELSLKLAVGRNSVRNALLSLENKNIIVRHIGKGSFLKTTHFENGKANIDVRLFEVNFTDILEIKTDLEKLAIKKAIDKGTDEMFNELIQKAKNMTVLAKKGDYFKNQ